MWGQPPSAVRRAKLDLLSAGSKIAELRSADSRGRLSPHKPAVQSESYQFAINDFNAIIDCMASITIRNLEDATKRKLKIRAAMHGHSMEQEAREILKSALAQKAPKAKSGAELVKRIRAIWEPLGGVELEPLPREPMPDPKWLKDWK